MAGGNPMTDRTTRCLGLVLGIALLLAVCARAGEPRPPAGWAPVFERDVLPVLAARCVRCHGGKRPRARLDLRTRAGMLQGGESGPALVPGSAARSLLFQLVRKGDMPPRKKTPLTARQVTLVQAWIDGGAPALEKTAAAGASLVTAADRNFWAFQKPVRPPVPRVHHADRVRTPIDAFILARLEEKGLTLAPDADRGTLVRRLFLDLLGLPPCPEEVDAFRADTRPDAYERLVDRL